MSKELSAIAREAAWEMHSSFAKERQVGHRKRMGGFTIDMLNILTEKFQAVYEAGRSAGIKEAAKKSGDNQKAKA